MNRRVASLGGLPAVRMAWDTLGMYDILRRCDFEKRSGVPTAELAFMMTTKQII